MHTKGSKYKLSHAQILDNLQEQREFLRRACDVYDGGYVKEAKRIASIAYIICHDGWGKTKSLLGQVGIKKSIGFISNGRQLSNDYNLIGDTKLAMWTIAGKRATYIPLSYFPPIQVSLTKLSFKNWYDEDIIKQEYRAGGSRRLNRKNLIFNLRSKDGGSHADDEIEDELYGEISYGPGMGVDTKCPDGLYRPVPNAHFASMRQIGWEIEQSLVGFLGGPTLPPDGVTGPTVQAVRYLDPSGKEVPPLDVPVEHQMGLAICETNIRTKLPLKMGP